MKFGCTIVYVPDVPTSLNFFEQAFGFPRRFLARVGNVRGVGDRRNHPCLCGTSAW